MQAQILCSLLLLLSFQCCFCWFFRHPQVEENSGCVPTTNLYKVAPGSSRNRLGIIKHFLQTVDHGGQLSNATFQQRYYIDTSFQTASGPVLFVLVGEGSMDTEVPLLQVPPITTWASRLGAVIIALEHRYYGQSFPVSSLTPENMTFLSSQQALADAATVVATMKNSMFAGRKWISIGCSYSGALSAWMRNKYPHLVDAAIAGSAPVHAQTSLPQYLSIFKNVTSPSCSEALEQAARWVHKMSQSPDGRLQLQAMFNTCQPLTDQNVMQFFWRLSLAMPLQDNIPFNGNPLNKFCGAISPGDVNRTVHLWATGLGQTSCMDLKAVGAYNPRDLQNVSLQHFPDYGKSWAWQLCTEFGWFMSNDPRASIFPWKIDSEYLLSMCGQSFVPNLQPNVEWTNVQYGNRDFSSSSNILFVNGISDPWNWLAVHESVPAFVEVVSYNSAHCAPFFPITNNDSFDLTETREKMFLFLQQHS